MKLGSGYMGAGMILMATVFGFHMSEGGTV